jgi:hypothetical protein
MLSKNLYLIILTCTLSGCVISNEKYFSSIQLASDEAYGYTLMKPISIKNGDLKTSISTVNYFLQHLTTITDERLLYVNRFTVDNPSFKEPDIVLYNRYSGEQIGAGAPFIDKYIFVSEVNRDTIILFTNPYQKSDLYIPLGLKLIQ